MKIGGSLNVFFINIFSSFITHSYRDNLSLEKKERVWLNTSFTFLLNLCNVISIK